MRAPDRRAMVERPGKDLSVRRQCALLNLARSGVYRPKPVTGANDLALMRRIDELHLELPFYGSRRMTFELNKEGRGVNRKRVQRLMRVMGEAGSEPRMGGRHHLYPDGAWLSVSGSNHRLDQPGGFGLAAIEHDRQQLLRGSA
jgi:HTH-like domain